MRTTRNGRLWGSLAALVLLVGCKTGPMSQVMAQLAPSAEQRALQTHCFKPQQDILSLERAHGPISRDNLRSYGYSTLSLRHHIPACATLMTEAGSSARNEQEQALSKMLEVFTEQHELIDQFGDGGSFSVTDQNLFAPETPLSPFHTLCVASEMDQVESRIERTWPVVEINDVLQGLSGKTQLVAFQNRVAEQRDTWRAKAKEKSDACLATKLEELRPYTDKAPTTVRAEWDKSVRASFAAAMNAPVLKTVYPHESFKHVVEERRELNHDNSVRVTKVDYFVMDVYVYVDAGDFVDAYVVSIFKDQIQGTSYSKFMGVGPEGPRRAQRVLKKNFS